LTDPGLLNAPAFQDVANDPAVTRAALRAFLSTSHADMPNVILSPAEADDIIAYIMKLCAAQPKAEPAPDGQTNGAQ
jgi:mono/diheme cytochrome c family protein